MAWAAGARGIQGRGRRGTCGVGQGWAFAGTCTLGAGPHAHGRSPHPCPPCPWPGPRWRRGSGPPWRRRGAYRARLRWVGWAGGGGCASRCTCRPSDGVLYGACNSQGWGICRLHMHVVRTSSSPPLCRAAQRLKGVLLEMWPTSTVHLFGGWPRVQGGGGREVVTEHPAAGHALHMVH